MQQLKLRIPPVLLVIVTALMMWGLDKLFPGAGYDLPGSPWQAALPVAAGLLIALSGVWEFRRANTSVDPRAPEKASSLVTTGIFRYSRNPMYLGFLLVLLGWAYYLANGLTLLMLPVFVLYMNHFQIMPEEQQMLAKFGQTFRDYKAHVRRWI